jgi:putative transposase
MKSRFKKLSHSIYECKYHIVYVPKYRYRIFEGEVKAHTERITYNLARQKDQVEIETLNVQKDHVHMVVSIPPKYAVSNIVGFLKGKTAIELMKRYERLGKRYWGRHLWSRGFCCSTVGLNEEQIKKYVEWQEKKDKEAEQLGLELDD